MFKTAILLFLATALLTLQPESMRVCASCCVLAAQAAAAPDDGCCPKERPVPTSDIACDCAGADIWGVVPAPLFALPPMSVVEQVRLATPLPTLAHIQRGPPARGHDPPPAPYIRTIQLLI